MTTIIEKRNNQVFWYLAYILFFVAILTFSALILTRVNGGLPSGITTFDLVLIILATFRLTRLLIVPLHLELEGHFDQNEC